MRGKFITFEGIDGVGKSTQIRILSERLLSRGYEVVVTREPGGTGVSEDVRKILLDTGNRIAPVTEALLYAAARAQTVAEVIMPAIESNKTVICDRYVDSSFAYQGYGRELGWDLVWDINKYATQGLMPDLTFVMMLEPKQSQMRRKGGKDRLEREDDRFFDRVAEGFEQIASLKRSVRIDAGKTVEEIANMILEKTMELLKRE